MGPRVPLFYRFCFGGYPASYSSTGIVDHSVCFPLVDQARKLRQKSHVTWNLSAIASRICSGLQMPGHIGNAKVTQPWALKEKVAVEVDVI